MIEWPGNKGRGFNLSQKEEDFFVTKREVAFSKLEKGLTRLQKKILSLAYGRSLEKEDYPSERFLYHSTDPNP